MSESMTLDKAIEQAGENLELRDAQLLMNDEELLASLEVSEDYNPDYTLDDNEINKLLEEASAMQPSETFTPTQEESKTESSASMQEEAKLEARQESTQARQTEQGDSPPRNANRNGEGALRWEGERKSWDQDEFTLASPLDTEDIQTSEPANATEPRFTSIDASTLTTGETRSQGSSPYRETVLIDDDDDEDGEIDDEEEMSEVDKDISDTQESFGDDDSDSLAYEETTQAASSRINGEQARRVVIEWDEQKYRVHVTPNKQLSEFINDLKDQFVKNPAFVHHEVVIAFRDSRHRDFRLDIYESSVYCERFKLADVFALHDKYQLVRNEYNSDLCIKMTVHRGFMVEFEQLRASLKIDDPDAAAYEVAGDRPQNPIVVDSNPGSPVPEFQDVNSVDDATALTSPAADNTLIGDKDDYAQVGALSGSENRNDVLTRVILPDNGHASYSSGEADPDGETDKYKLNVEINVLDEVQESPAETITTGCERSMPLDESTEGLKETERSADLQNAVDSTNVLNDMHTDEVTEPSSKDERHAVGLHHEWEDAKDLATGPSLIPEKRERTSPDTEADNDSKKTRIE